MKGFKKWSSVCLPVALIVGLVAGWLVVQQVGVTPSEAQVGPGSQMQGPPPKLPPKLKASPTPPPEEQEMGPPPDQTPRQRPTRESLLEKIRQMPGGKEMLEEAKKRGARIGMGPVKSESALSYLNPLRVKVAEAQSTLSLTLDASNTWYSASPYGYAAFRGVLFSKSNPATTRVYLYVVVISPTGTQIIQPSLSFTFDAPADGWYIVNVEATGVNANMKHFHSGGTYPILKSWSYSGSVGTLSYPVLVELTAGRHYFYWVSSMSAYVYEANAYSI